MRLVLLLLIALMVPLAAWAKIPKACHQCHAVCGDSISQCIDVSEVACPTSPRAKARRCNLKAKRLCKKQVTLSCIATCKQVGTPVCPTTTTTTEPNGPGSPGSPTTTTVPGGGGGTPTTSTTLTITSTTLPGGGGGTTTTTLAVQSQWVPLIGRSWTMPALSEGYRCRRIQVQSDMYITGFRAASTSTVFQMTVSVSSTSAPLGDYDCSPNNIDQRVIYESGIGTNDLEFPLGVGVHLHAGDYVNVNLSLDNEGTKAADGFAGILVRTGSAASVINNAGLVLAGTFSISIPNDGMPHTANGGCPWHSENQVVALWPHLHARGTHVNMLIAPGASTPQTVIDAPYAIDHQPIIPAALALHPGDNVGVTCTYVNNTQTNPLVFGDSPGASEQCFVGMYVWPSEGLSVFDCVSN